MPKSGFAIQPLIIVIALILGGFAFWFFRGSASSFSPANIAKKAEPCPTTSYKRVFNNTPYYSGPLFDDHFHMPQMFKIPDHPQAPVLNQDISGRDVICLFDKDKIKGAIAFYGIPVHLKDQSLKSAREIEGQYPGVLSHFIELVSFPGYPVVPDQVDQILSSNKGLFKGYGEFSLYLPHYNGVMPNDPKMKELYKIAQNYHLVVMMHPVESQQKAVEEMLGEFPNVKFLFHAFERLSWVNTFFDTDLDKYPNAYYSIDIDIFGEDTTGRPILDCCQNKEDFISKFKTSWQASLDKKVAFWKSKIEKHPDRFLWGTDRGAYLWHYDPEIAALLEEYSRAFIGQLDPAVQEKYAHKNAESLLQK